MVQHEAKTDKSTSHRQFLATLWPEDIPAGSAIVVCRFKPDRIERATSLEQAAKIIDRWSPEADIYFGCGLQPPSGSGRGKAIDVRAIPGLWADIDIGKHASGKAYPPTIDDALGLLGEMPIPPSLIVNSGGGLHAWWLLAEPWVFDDDAERQRAQRILKGWQTVLCNKAGVHGWAVDSTHDLARVLRPAGTLNHKYDPPREIRILETSDSRFIPTDFEPWEATKAPSESKGGAEHRSNGHVDQHDRETAIAALWALSLDRADDYDRWTQVGMVLHAIDSSPEMLAEFDRWSRQSDKHREGEPAEKWVTFNRERPDGLGLGSLVAWAREDSPDWQPPKRNAISNCREISDPENPEKTIRVPLSMAEILDEIGRQTDGWPCRVGNSLFVDDGGEICWLQKTAALLGWLGTRTGKAPRFNRKVGAHAAEDVLSELQRTATEYRAVEPFAHEPPIPGHYYVGDSPQAGDGKTLRAFLEYFSPETEIDRDLLLAAIVTCFWGGRPGARPAFVLTADKGRGSGKSTIAHILGYVSGGVLDFDAQDDAGEIKARLLSAEGMSKRVALLDNVKSHRFSNSSIESLITAPVISGKRMYVGEAERPNTLVWILTLNGVSLATDMAQRAVVIKMEKPTFGGTWEEDTRKFIDDNRQAIIADCVGYLRQQRHPLERFTRWSAWERDVLSRLPEPGEAQAVILDRQAEVNVEHEEARLIEDFFRERLADAHYDPAGERIFIPSAIARLWLNEAENERYTTTKATRTLKQKIREGELRRLSICNRNDLGRGFLWEGENSSPDERPNADLETRLKGSN